MALPLMFLDCVCSHQDIENPPVVNVTLGSGILSDAVDLTEHLEPLDVTTKDNIFRFDVDSGHWINNLSTKVYGAPGTYTVEVLSGDDTSYIIDPSCTGEFVRLE